jgi:hypothetical protein
MPTVHYVSRELLRREFGILTSPDDESCPDLATALRRHASSSSVVVDHCLSSSASGNVDDGMKVKYRGSIGTSSSTGDHAGEMTSMVKSVVDGSSTVVEVAATAAKEPSIVVSTEQTTTKRTRVPSTMLEMSDAPPGLPPGWKSKTFGRRGNTDPNRITKTNAYTFWYSPNESIMFRSLKNCRLFIDIMNELGDGADEIAAFKEFKARVNRA